MVCSESYDFKRWCIYKRFLKLNFPFFLSFKAYKRTSLCLYRHSLLRVCFLIFLVRLIRDLPRWYLTSMRNQSIFLKIKSMSSSYFCLLCRVSWVGSFYYFYFSFEIFCCCWWQILYEHLCLNLIAYPILFILASFCKVSYYGDCANYALEDENRYLNQLDGPRNIGVRSLFRPKGWLRLHFDWCETFICLGNVSIQWTKEVM